MNSQPPLPPSLPDDAPGRRPARPPFPAVLFYAALLGPPILTFLAVLSRNDGLTIGVALIGSGLGGLVCGAMLGQRVAQTTAGKVLFSILFVCLFCGAILTMSFFGCAAGGYSMNFR